MRILYFDLNEKTLVENYSVSGSAAKYGAGGITAKHFLNDKIDFYLAARKECFEGIPESKQNQCIVLSENDIVNIRNGWKLIQISSIPRELLNSIDLVFHHFTNIWINTDLLNCKTLCWAVGRGDYINPGNKNLALYSREYQSPIVQFNTNIFDVIIGKDIEPFQEIKKEPYIFQCSRHNEQFGSKIVAEWCIKNKVRGFFGGPIGEGYDLMNYIDGKYTHYLGIISEKVKRLYTRRARLTSYLFNWEAPFSIGILDSLSYNTPVVTTRRGFTRSIIKHGVNGFFYGDYPLDYAWENASRLSQSEIHLSSLKYSKERMIESFEKAFNEIVSQ